MSSNPYAPPKAAVADAEPAQEQQGGFVPGGRGVSAGRGLAWLIGGWKLFKQQPLRWVGITLIAFALFGVTALVKVAGTLAMTVLWPVFAAGLAIGCRALDEGGSLKVGHLFAGFRDRFATLAMVGLVYLAAYLAVLLLIGLIFGLNVARMLVGIEAPVEGMQFLLASLVMMALLLPVFMAIWFAPYLVCFHERGALQAMKESFYGCLKNILPFLVYGLVMFLAAFGALIPVGLASALLAWLIGPFAMVLVFVALLLIAPPLYASAYPSYRDIYFES